MSKQISFRPSLKTALKTSTVAGLAALMLATGIPAQVVQSFAEPVKVTGPQVASFGDVVDAVSPAVVSVRVQSDIKPASDDSGSTFNFNFGGRGFDELPDDHPLKRFFREKDRIRLQPANAEMEPIYASEVQIQGKVVGVIRRLA